MKTTALARLTATGCVEVSAPAGTYQPGARSFVFSMRGAKPVRVSDDGRAHSIKLR
jgi:hypothetical protein